MGKITAVRMAPIINYILHHQWPILAEQQASCFLVSIFLYKVSSLLNGASPFYLVFSYSVLNSEIKAISFYATEFTTCIWAAVITSWLLPVRTHSKLFHNAAKLIISFCVKSFQLLGRKQTPNRMGTPLQEQLLLLSASSSHPQVQNWHSTTLHFSSCATLCIVLSGCWTFTFLCLPRIVFFASSLLG